MQKARCHPAVAGLQPLVSVRFQVYFTPLFAVLFTFPSQYWFAIGLSAVFSLGGWFRRIQTGSHVSRLTQDTTRYRLHAVYGTVTRYGPTFQKGSTMKTNSTSWSYNPGCAETPPVWADPCSLATTRGISDLISFPPGT